MTTINVEAIMAQVDIREENKTNVKSYLEKVASNLDFNIDAYELKMICIAYNDGLNARLTPGI